MPETTYCARHTGIPTNLRCGRCDTLVCPQCMVHAPVGIRCQDCGRAARLPVYDLSAGYLARAALVSALLGVVGGALAAIIVRPLLYGILYVAALGGFGYAVGEGVSASVNRKRGRALQILAAGGVLVGLLVITFLPEAWGGGLSLFDLLGGGLGVYVATIRLR